MTIAGTTRGDTTASCRAPLVTMEFDPFGDVQACCANALYPLGNVAHSSVGEIWRGSRRALLAAAVAAGDLSLGCTVCRYRLDHRGAERPFEAYSELPVPPPDADWPYRLSFSLHNTCNLECVMCGADRSSRIRSRRDHLSPLPHVYGPEFFEQIVPFLDHCGEVDFVGGEPFIVREHWRIWDLLVERGLRPTCGITTNATVWNDRVEQVLHAFDTHVRVSIDGRSRAVFEGIRSGADHAEVLANLERFRDYCRMRGTHLAVNWSFVRQNWFELAEMMVWAESEGIPVNVMTVIEPEFGVQRMPTDELRLVAETLHRQSDRILPSLGINRESWLRQVAMIDTELELRDAGARLQPLMEPASNEDVAAVVELILAECATWSDVDTTATRRDDVRASLARWYVEHPSAPADPPPIGTVELTRHGAVTALELRPVTGPGARAEQPDSLAGLLGYLAVELGGHPWIVEELVEGGVVSHTLLFGSHLRDKRGVVVRLRSFATPDGIEVVVARDDWFGWEPLPAVSVSISAQPPRSEVSAVDQDAALGGR